MTYTYAIDIGELHYDNKKFSTEEEALQYGQQLFDHCGAPFITLYNEEREIIKEYQREDE